VGIRQLSWKKEKKKVGGLSGVAYSKRKKGPAHYLWADNSLAAETKNSFRWYVPLKNPGDLANTEGEAGQFNGKR